MANVILSLLFLLGFVYMLVSLIVYYRNQMKLLDRCDTLAKATIVDCKYKETRISGRLRGRYYYVFEYEHLGEIMQYTDKVSRLIPADIGEEVYIRYSSDSPDEIYCNPDFTFVVYLMISIIGVIGMFIILLNCIASIFGGAL